MSEGCVMDGVYVVQALWSDGTIYEEFSLDDEAQARREAIEWLRSPVFQADRVCIITRDGEFVWSSDGAEGFGA